MNSKKCMLVALSLSMFVYLGCARAKVDTHIDLALACDRSTPTSDKVNYRTSHEDQAMGIKDVCVDRRFVFKNLHVLGLDLSYLKKFESYVLSVQFDPSQLDELNGFISTVMNRHSYVIMDSVVMDARYHSMFTSELAAPEFDISFDSEKAGTEFGDALSGHNSVEVQH